MTLAPLTPEDCDLRGYEWMPLFGERLFTSTFEAHACDMAFRVAIKLYWECWKQVPAASLPNDDVQLCRLAGLGRDLKSWRKLRSDGVLHGFRLCSDDRLYHGLLAVEALKAWESRRRQQAEREVSRQRMRRWRSDSGLSTQEWDDLREAVFARDGGKCVECGASERLHCDHIKPLAFGGSNHPDNLATRCSTCHGRKTAKQQNPKKPPDVTAHKPDVTAHKSGCEPRREPGQEPIVSLARDKGQGSTVQEKEDFLNLTSFIPPNSAREAAEWQEPEEPEPTEAEVMEQRQAFAEQLECSAPDIAAHVRRAANANRMRFPLGEVRSLDAQRDALAAQPAAVGADVAMGLCWQPAEPVRSVEEQMRALLADCTPDQIARAKRYARA